MAGLILKNLSKSFGDLKVLDSINLELNEGEFLVLLGPSGCGKSTCLRLIAGLEDVDAGEIYIGNRQVEKIEPKDRKVAMVFQNYSLYPHMTVEKNLAFPLKVAGVASKTIKEKVIKTAEMIGLSDRLKHKPNQLSGGQRQRVALGRAVIRQPDIFLLDEPLSNLDADLRIKMRREIVRIQQELNCTTVYVTHDQEEALSMGDRIALLDNGHIVQFDTPVKIYNYPVNLFAAQFIGTPKINIVEAIVEEATIRPFGINIPTGVRRGNYKKLLLGVRPDAIKIDIDGYYSAVVTSCEFVGDSYTITIEYDNNLLTVSNLQEPKSISENVRFTINTDAILYFDPISKKSIN